MIVLLLVIGAVTVMSVVLMTVGVYRATNQASTVLADVVHRNHCTGPITGHCNGPRCPWNPINQ